MRETEFPYNHGAKTMEVEKERKLRKSSFYLDILPERQYNGFTFGETWNGWACPYFIFEEAKRIAKDQEILNEMVADDEKYEGKYIGSEDKFSFYEPYNDEWYDFKAVDINGKKLYPVGTRYWTWSEVE